MSLAALIAPEEVRERLERIFPAEFPDRTILVGPSAARTVFVALYGGFVGGTRCFRPSTIINFSNEQAALASDEQRETWSSECHKARFQAAGRSWYKENSREQIRDDLIRNRLIPLGVVFKKEGFAPTASTPLYSFSPTFMALFAPALTGHRLDAAVATWQQTCLNPHTLRRMALLSSGVRAKKDAVVVKLPTTGKTLRLAAGEASVITRDVCEVLASAMYTEPVVVHLSMSDRKTFPELAAEGKAVGLTFDASAELPDVVFVDAARDPMRVAFVEVVHSDGAISELRAKALLGIAANAGIPADHVDLVTAFDDRSADGFRKRFSELAMNSSVWFRSEPDLLMTLETLRAKPVAAQPS